MNTHRPNPTPLARLVHLLLLLGLLFSSHGILPAICMLAAVLDGDHAVKVGVSNEGAMTVVLSHAGKSAVELTSHEHDALCRVLVSLAEIPASDAADHVLAFKPVDDTSRIQRLSLPVMAKPSLATLLVAFRFPRPPSAHAAARLLQGCTRSQGPALKSGRTVMRC